MSGTWYYTWAKKQLKSDKEIPSVPHYAIMVFSNQQFSEAGYDRDDPSTTITVRKCDYYAFSEVDKSEWEKMISDIHKERLTSKSTLYGVNDDENVVFFHSSGRGNVDIKINVNITSGK